MTNGIDVKISKREKLKTLLIQKFHIKFPMLDLNFLTNKVTQFIQGEKLTDLDLKNFEEKLKILSSNKQEEHKIKKLFDSDSSSVRDAREGRDSEYHHMKNNFLPKNNQEEFDNKSVSKMSDVNSIYDDSQSRNFSSGLKYEDITNFGLRKLLQTERKPLIKENLKIYPDEWTAIADYKKKVWEETKKESKVSDQMKKSQTRQTYQSQMNEKCVKKQTDNMTENIFHRDLMHNLEMEKKEEFKKSQQMKEKMHTVKDMQDKQIKENIDREKNEFLLNRQFDNSLSKLH